MYSSCSVIEPRRMDRYYPKKQNVSLKQSAIYKKKPAKIKLKIKNTRPLLLARYNRPLKKKRRKPVLSLKYDKKKFNMWVKYFSKRGKNSFQRHLNNSFLYKKIVSKILRKHGIPEDIFFVGLIESGYNSKIKSHAGATGHWQFMKKTGIHYGLVVDKYIDERRNIYKSTAAAAGYFKDLYNIFGSWELALCAYNAGEYRIIGAIRRGKSRDYITLTKKGLIPKETSNYVPKVAAARYIFKNMKKFGFYEKKYNLNLFKKVKTVTLYQSFNLRKMAEFINVPLSVLSFLNPDLKRNYIRVKKKSGLQVYLPQKGVRPMKRLNKRNNQKNRPIYKLARQKKRTKTVFYTVKRGDNLTSIARKLKTTVARLARANQLKRNRIYPGQKLKVKRNNIYIVKKGESLYHIAKRFKLKLSTLLKANSLKLSSAKIFPSQKLIIPL